MISVYRSRWERSVSFEPRAGRVSPRQRLAEPVIGVKEAVIGIKEAERTIMHTRQCNIINSFPSV